MTQFVYMQLAVNYNIAFSFKILCLHFNLVNINAKIKFFIVQLFLIYIREVSVFEYWPRH